MGVAEEDVVEEKEREKNDRCLMICTCVCSYELGMY